MKTIQWYPGRRKVRDGNPYLLHIEAEGCIVNVHIGLADAKGRKVTAVSIIPDDERSGGDGQGRIWRAVGGYGARVIRLKTSPKAKR